MALTMAFSITTCGNSSESDDVDAEIEKTDTI